MIKKIIGSVFILLALIGLILEAANFFEEGIVDITGLVLIIFFIVVGLLLVFWRHLLSFQRGKEENKQINKDKNISSKKRTFLISAGIIEIVTGLVFMVFIIILGFYGIVAGEMGIMIGIFSSIFLIFILPYLVFKFLMVYGLRKRRRWSLFISLLFSIIYILAGLFFVFSVPIFSLLLFLYAGFTLWAALNCLQDPFFVPEEIKSSS